MKLIQRNWLGSLLVLCLLISCFNTYSQSKLPDAWPADMVLKVTYGGGMRDYTSTIEIRMNGSYINIKSEDGNTNTALNFTQKELDELLRFLKANRFDRIKSAMRPDIVYDMGTTSTTLTWGEQVFGMSVGASTEIVAGYEKQYEAIRIYIDKLLDNKTKSENS